MDSTHTHQLLMIQQYAHASGEAARLPSMSWAGRYFACNDIIYDIMYDFITCILPTSTSSWKAITWHWQIPPAGQADPLLQPLIRTGPTGHAVKILNYSFRKAANGSSALAGPGQEDWHQSQDQRRHEHPADSAWLWSPSSSSPASGKSRGAMDIATLGTGKQPGSLTGPPDTQSVNIT